MRAGRRAIVDRRIPLIDPHIPRLDISGVDVQHSVSTAVVVEGASSAEANGPPMLSIDCMTPAVVPLVMDTVQRAIESAVDAGSAPLRKEA